MNQRIQALGFQKEIRKYFPPAQEQSDGINRVLVVGF